MSRTRVNTHVPRKGAVVAGVLLLLTGWLPVASASPPLDPFAANPFRGMIARCDGSVLNSSAATT
jgi:hypothetical protein